MQMNYHKIMNMKKLLILLGFLTFYCSIFGQYTGNKLPSGLTVSTTVDSADYTIIQKNGETIVKAVRMDTLKAYFSAGIIESIEPLDSVSGSTGQFIISDGSGWLAPVSAKYEGNGAYTFGQRLSGAIGLGSIVLVRGRATGVRSFTINGITASGVDAISMNGSTVSGTSSIGINGSNVSGSNSAGINGVIVSGNYSTGINGATVSGNNSIGVGMFCNTTADYAMSVGYKCTASGKYSYATGLSTTALSYAETTVGSLNTQPTPSSTTTWVDTDRLFVIGNGKSAVSHSDALVMLKNGNTTVNGNWTFTNNISVDTLTANHIEQVGTFAEIYYADASTAQSFPNGTTYTKITSFTTDGEESNCTADAANDKITITETGYYEVTGYFSTICTTNGTVGKTALFLGGNEVNKIHKQSTWTNTVSPHSGSIGGIIKVETVPIDVDVRLRHDQGTPVNFTGVYGNLSVRKIGDL